jgi:hypothetical protein
VSRHTSVHAAAPARETHTKVGTLDDGPRQHRKHPQGVCEHAVEEEGHREQCDRCVHQLQQHEDGHLAQARLGLVRPAADHAT